MTQDHTSNSNYPTLNFWLLCNQDSFHLRVSSRVGATSAHAVCFLRVLVWVYASTWSEWYVYLLIICWRFASFNPRRSPMLRNTLSAGRGRGRLDASLPNAAPVVDQRRKSKRKPAEKRKVYSETIACPEMCGRYRLFSRVLDGSLHVTSSVYVASRQMFISFFKNIFPSYSAKPFYLLPRWPIDTELFKNISQRYSVSSYM